MSSSTSERKRYHKDNAPTDDILTLINLVRQNPALYNYKLQPNQRRRSDVLNGWQEVAQQIGNKYTVQEVRRKWKNLRDTFHQYRLRTPKYIEGRLSKWRYAKELDFLSTVYQPKLKSHRNTQSGYETSGGGGGGGSTNSTSLPIGSMLHLKQQVVDDDDDEVVDDDGQSDHDTATLSSHHGASQITLVSDEAETFILTAYEEGVSDDTVSPHHHHHHHGHHHQQQQHHHHQPHHHHHHHQSQHDGSISSIELSQIAHDDDVVDDVDDDDDVVDHDGQVDIVKHELEEDGATGAEVDYEEVCLYEEASGAHVDCEMGVSDAVDGSSDVTHGKGFHYIDAHDFCISDIEPQPVRLSSQHQFASSGASGNASNSVLAGGALVGDGKLKNLTLVTTTAASSAPSAGGPSNRHDSSASTQHISLVDVTEATSTSVTISSTPAISLNAATVTTTPAAALCNTTSFTSTPTATILQLPALSCGGSGQPLAVSAAASSSSILVKEEELHQQHQVAQALAKRDELDLFFDFLKKKMQCFSKTQITHIQMEFLNCVSRQEAAEQDGKD
ncbi:lateral signaling target protein 2 homolog [Drosophila ficusphila]|uniref:lateral signaling target protein 2 homolog n=1 Tax=Drosophila ficusphila TaxID=30025 RepID=UPI0007E863E2|nr:lateral signaling target protein 2 homolog [Drosophila ficusphila]